MTEDTVFKRNFERKRYDEHKWKRGLLAIKDQVNSFQLELLKVRVYHSLKLASTALLYVSLTIIALRLASVDKTET